MSALTYAPELIATSDKGCTDTASQMLEVYPLPYMTPVISQIGCYGDISGSILAHTWHGTAPYQYSMNGVNWQPDSVFNSLSPGNYLVLVNDAHGCGTWDSVHIVQPLPLVSYYVQTDASCYGYSDGSIDLSASGGTVPYTYLWSNGETTQDVNGLATGSYEVTVTDSNNCVTFNQAYINQPFPLVMTYESTASSCDLMNDGSITVSGSGGTSPYQYFWTGGAIGDYLEGLSGGTYTVTLTDAQGCSLVSDIEVMTDEGNCLNIPTSFTPNDDGKNDTWILRNIGMYPDCIVQIYNRWGNLIFESKGYSEPWDGTYKDRPVPPETYYYVIVLSPGSEGLTGTVTIVK